jgi:DNA-binding response OmpR family regulator
MPIMDGWQATSRIRERKALNATTPIIAVTANAMKGDRDKCIAAGMNDYISKPVERKRLFETISKWVSKADSVVTSPGGVMKPSPLSAFSEGPASKLLEETKTVEQVMSP